ncbi:MAG TPA: hypothetical protein VL832_00475 [Puia sp.]|nr:hypothetical protein [Puia sp.]
MTSSRFILSLALTGLVNLCSLLTSYGQEYMMNTTRDPAGITPPPARQAIYAEIGGAGVVLSLNYDTRLTKKEGGLGVRGGIGYSCSSNPSFLTVPVGLNYLLGGKGHYLEMGAGVSYLHITNDHGYDYLAFANKAFYKDRTDLLFETLNIGYRRQSSTTGLNFRIGLAPIFGEGVHGVGGYLGIGYNF